MLKEIKGLNEECGVFGAFNVNDAARHVNYGLHMLQHRGQDGAGIIAYDQESEKYNKHKAFGLVSEVFNNDTMAKMSGKNAIGHVRYATSGGSEIENIQPFLFYGANFSFSLCHNGNIVNSDSVKKFLQDKGSIFQSNSDSEILAHLIMHHYQGEMVSAIKSSLNLLEGAFAFLIMHEDKMYACRDKHGLRPLSIAKNKDGYLVASETCAFSLTNGLFLRDIKPGEIVEFSAEGMQSHYFAKNIKRKMCAMEYIYFARPDSDIDGENVHKVRYETGCQIARETAIDADIVMGVPDSSLSAALGFANESKIAYAQGLVKHKYVGRTFIEPTQDMREHSVNLKLGVIKDVVQNKRVVLVDDSIVRGTTSRKIIDLIREAGAKEIHMIVASPPITGACFYGVDIHSEDELIAANKTVEEICALIGADSLNYLSLEGLKKSVENTGLCHGCFTKEYPTYLYKG